MSMLPKLLAEPHRFTLVGALKLATDVSERIYLAAGPKTILIPSLGAVGIGFGSVTYGGAER